MKIFRKISLAACMLTLPSITFAWGVNGHRICGEIAYSYLNPKAKLAIKKYLGEESLAMASNYADFIRSDDKYKDTENWHYMDVDKAMTQLEMKTYLEADTDVDAYTKIKFLMGELKKKDLPAATQAFNFKMLIHLIEDIHQPMHTAHKADKGGNDIKVMWFGKQTSLHTLWDSELINFQQLSYTEYAANINHSTAAQRATLQAAPISTWFSESNQLADKIYTNTKAGDNLSYNYNYQFIEPLNQQLLKGGIRLAGVLNEMFGK